VVARFSAFRQFLVLKRHIGQAVSRGGHRCFLRQSAHGALVVRPDRHVPVPVSAVDSAAAVGRLSPECVDALGSMKVAEPGSVPGSLAHYGLVGVSGTTAGTPSGLMLKASVNQHRTGTPLAIGANTASLAPPPHFGPAGYPSPDPRACSHGGRMAPTAGGTPPDVDRDIEDRPARHSHELALRRRHHLVLQPAQRPLQRVADVIVLQCLRDRDDTRSISARRTPEVTKVRWMMTRHLRAASSSGGSPPIRPRTGRLTSGVRGRLTALNEPRQHDGADAYD
jgi:hypothetical protein